MGSLDLKLSCIDDMYPVEWWPITNAAEKDRVIWEHKKMITHDDSDQDEYASVTLGQLAQKQVEEHKLGIVKPLPTDLTEPKLGSVRPIPGGYGVQEIDLPDTNPKSVFGMKKPALHLVPQTFLVMVSKVMMLGAKKYGAYNWRTNSVAASVYVGAAMRHIASWWDGEDLDPESGAPHLAHAAACCAIIIDAWATGNLIDDRPPVGAAARLISELTDAS